MLFRSQLAGYRCLYVAEAVIYHKYHQTSARVGSFTLQLRERNKYFVLIKNLPTKFFLICAPLFLLHEAFALLQAIRFSQLKVYFAARRDVWRHVPQLLQRRRKLQRERIVDDRYLFEIMRFREPLRVLFYRPVHAFVSRLRTIGRVELTGSRSRTAERILKKAKSER